MKDQEIVTVDKDGITTVNLHFLNDFCLPAIPTEKQFQELVAKTQIARTEGMGYRPLTRAEIDEWQQDEMTGYKSAEL